MTTKLQPKQAIDSSFRVYDSNFRAKYSRLMQEFPYAFLLVEKDLRLSCTGLESHADKSMNKMARFNIKKAIYRNVVQHIPVLFFSQRKTYVCLPSFPVLGEKLSQLSLKIQREESQVSKRAFSFMPNQINWFALTLVSLKLKLLLAHYRDVGITSVKDVWWRDVNSLVKKEIVSLSLLMQKFGLKKIICQGDQTATSRVVREAARRVGVKYIVIAHGYVKNSHLAGYGPIYADRLYVWSQKQMNFVKELLYESDQKKKVFYAGSPLPCESDICKEKLPTKRSGIPTCLIAMSPLPTDLIQRDTYVSVFKSYMEKMSQMEYEIIVRPHPKDARLIQNLKAFRSYEISSREISSDIMRCDFILVSRSSVAYNAISLGKLAVQIANLDQEEIEGAVRMDLVGFQKFIEGIEVRESKKERKHSSTSELSKLALKLSEI